MASNISGTAVAPIFSFDIQSGGNFENDSRCIIFGLGTSAGSMAEDSIAPCSSFTEARLLAGAGSMLESMFLKTRANAPAQQIWLARVAEAGVAQVKTIKVNTVSAAGGQGLIQIAGEIVSVSFAAGATAANVATALAAAINAYFNPVTKKSLPYTATAATDTVTITARNKGAWAQDLDIYVPPLANSQNAFDGTNLTIAQTTAGSGTPSIANAIALVGDQPFDWPLCPFNDSTNIGILKTWLNETSGRWGWMKQIYGLAFIPKTETGANITTFGASQDTWHLVTVPRFSAGGNGEPEYEWLAAYVASGLPWLSDGASGNVSRNMTGLVIQGITPPRDMAYWPDYATRDAFLKNGISTWKVDSAGNVVIDKMITMSRTINGVPDTTFRDVQKIGQMMYAFRKFRAELAYEHGQKAIADANPQGLEALTTIKDIEATLVHTAKSMSGVIDKVNIVSAARNADNPNRIDVNMQVDMVNPLDIFAGLAKVYSQLAA